MRKLVLGGTSGQLGLNPNCSAAAAEAESGDFEIGGVMPSGQRTSKRLVVRIGMKYTPCLEGGQ